MSWSGVYNYPDESFKVRNCNDKYRHYRIKQNERTGGTSAQGPVHFQWQQSSGSVSKIENSIIGISNATVVGVIISKESPKSIISKKAKFQNERHLLSFVLRDSVQAFVNVTLWGNEHFIKQTSETYHIGDIVQLSNFQVQPKSVDGSDEKYRPSTPVTFQFSLNEIHATLSVYDGEDQDEYKSLLHLPTKANNDYYTLEDILANGQNLNGEHINVLAAVRKVGPIKNIKTKTGRNSSRCELKLLDETCSSFPLVLWDKEIAECSQNWIPLETVLFIADVRVSYDEFRSSMIATADSKTIFTVNPDTLEAHSLYQFSTTQGFLVEDSVKQAFGQEDPPLDTIKEYFNVANIKHKIQEVQKQWKPPIYGISCVYLTKFNLDVDDKNQIISFKCGNCKQKLTEDNGYACSNFECSDGVLNFFDASSAGGRDKVTIDFSIPVSLSDHTGTIDCCRMYGSTAEQLLGCKPEQFINVSSEKKTEMKWNFLLEKIKIIFKLYRGGENGRAYLQLLSCSELHGHGI